MAPAPPRAPSQYASAAELAELFGVPARRLDVFLRRFRARHFDAAAPIAKGDRTGDFPAYIYRLRHPDGRETALWRELCKWCDAGEE